MLSYTQHRTYSTNASILGVVMGVVLCAASQAKPLPNFQDGTPGLNEIFVLFNIKP